MTTKLTGIVRAAQAAEAAVPSGNRSDLVDVDIGAGGKACAYGVFAADDFAGKGEGAGRPADGWVRGTDTATGNPLQSECLGFGTAVATFADGIGLRKVSRLRGAMTSYPNKKIAGFSLLSKK